MTSAELRLTALIASALELPPAAIGPDASMETLEQWDSLAHLNICLAVQECFDVVLDMETIATATSVRGLLEVVAPATGSPARARI